MNCANILLIDSNGGYVADYFMPTDSEKPEQIALRIGRKLHNGRNQRGIASVVVIPGGAEVSRIVDVCDPRTVGFSSEFSTRMYLKHKRSYFN